MCARRATVSFKFLLYPWNFIFLNVDLIHKMLSFFTKFRPLVYQLFSFQHFVFLRWFYERNVIFLPKMLIKMLCLKTWNENLPKNVHPITFFIFSCGPNPLSYLRGSRVRDRIFVAIVKFMLAKVRAAGAGVAMTVTPLTVKNSTLKQVFADTAWSV